MSLKQLKSKYAGSQLGIWWAVFTPLLLAASINFVFTRVFNITIPNYSLFVLAGIIPWFFTTNALSEATNSFSVNKAVLKQGIFPREFIPLSSVMANFLNFLVGLVFLLPIFVVLNPRTVNLLPLLLLVIVVHFIFILSLGLLFAIVNIHFRDLSHFLTTAFMVWFWVTPVFYSLEMLNFPYRWICLVNPMTYFVILYQDILCNARIPNLNTFIIALTISIATSLFTYSLFIRSESSLLKKI